MEEKTTVVTVEIAITVETVTTVVAVTAVLPAVAAVVVTGVETLEAKAEVGTYFLGK